MLFQRNSADRSVHVIGHLGVVYSERNDSEINFQEGRVSGYSGGFARAGILKASSTEKVEVIPG